MVATGGARILALGVVLAAATACSSSSGPSVPAGLAQAGQPMQESPNVPGTLVWKKPGLNPASYTSFIITPPEIYQGADASFGNATPADKQAMAAYMGREFRRALGERYRITNTPGTGTARLQLTLAGMSGNVPVAATASRITPMGIVANVTRNATGGTPTFTGTVTIEGQFFDSRTGQPLATFITTRAPSAFDLGATLTSQDAQRAAVAGAANDLRDSLARAQSAALPAR
ncbi:MAG: DUF3313 domain-containing protein [Magnetospirillum sp.]|nr:DUF3313 domain-containing protein [Magnetospirillum sp.]